MKRMLWTLLTITLLVGVSGCCWPHSRGLAGGNCPHGTAESEMACGAECDAEACQQCGGEGCESCSGGVCQDCGGQGCETCGPAGCDPSEIAGCQACGGAGCEACRGARCGRCGRVRLAACGLPGCGGCAGRGAYPITPGPPSAAITYPYYTIRGPRDFLAKNPPSIGP
jgi:hypothetical protein